MVDDGSTDDISEKTVNHYKNNFKNIYFIRKKNGGPSSARNLGLNKSKHEFICFFDVDDLMIYDNLETKYNTLKELDMVRKILEKEKTEHNKLKKEFENQR